MWLEVTGWIAFSSSILTKPFWVGVVTCATNMQSCCLHLMKPLTPRPWRAQPIFPQRMQEIIIPFRAPLLFHFHWSGSPFFFFFFNLYSIILATGQKWHQWRWDLCIYVLVLFFFSRMYIFFVFKKKQPMHNGWRLTVTESQDRFEGTWSEFGTLGFLARWARWQWSILFGLDERHGSKDPWF